jgi:hypothetical protein
MDAKKLSGVLIACALAVSIIAAAPPAALAMLDVALIGALYVIRRRRSAGPVMTGSQRRSRP